MTDDRFEVIVDPVLGEQVLITETARRLPLRVAPTPRFRESAAVLTVRYGSIDLGFADGEEPVSTPEGMAHYLEHKLFEDEELQAFDRFARRGAQVNAMTGFARTQYYFTATDRFEDNLADLLHLVSHAHITDENVEKERGIIAQEVRMYEDSPQFCTLFDLLGALFENHPARHAVGGTVDSIAKITARGLLQCYRAFYRCGNAALAVAGPVDPAAVLEIAEGCELPAGAPPQSLTEEDVAPSNGRRAERRMHVARPKVLLGFKDRTLPRDDEDLLHRQLATRVLLDRLFAPSSEVRESLHQRDLVDDSLSSGYHGERSFGFTVVGCETDDPEGAVQALREVLLGPVPLAEEHLERMRRRALGQYVRSLESITTLAFGHCQEALEGTAPFRNMARLEALTLDDVERRRQELLREENLAIAITRVA